MTQRKSLKNVAQVPAAARPQYQRSQVQPGIVHLGVGAFHRAHQAVYTDALLATGELQWGITGVSLQSDAVRQRLAAQDFLYSVQERGHSGDRMQVVGSLCDVLALPHPGALEKVVSTIADANTQLVSLTITEKGYCHQPDGALDETHAGIVQDMRTPLTPTTAPGLLALAINQRFQANGKPLTILSCDNLSSNGQVTRQVVEQMVQIQFPEAAGWLADNLSFPSTMVDRIVPQTTAADIEGFSLSVGYRDAGLVICEPFSQWVIEDAFAGARPSWDRVGAQFVSSVQPFEQTKLRFLNATHSALAYLGLLAGYQYVHQAVEDPNLRLFAQSLMTNEIEAKVACPENFDLAGYKASILERFTNAQVPYKTAQVASDGSQKLPQRILPSILAANDAASTPGLCLVVAAWIESIHQNRGANQVFSDPLLETLQKLMDANSNADSLVQAIGQETSVLNALRPADLKRIAQALGQLRSKGVIAAVQSALRP